MIQLGPNPLVWPEPYKSRYAERLRARRPTDLPFQKYQTNPQSYAQDVLGVGLTPDQSSILESVKVNRFTLVKASHAIGKTFVASVAASWWYDCWQQHIAYVTAPTWPQALGLTFKQLKTLRRAKSLSGTILDTGIIKDENKAREGDHYVRALNAERGEGFQGEHAAPILVIIEEGVGVPKYIWDAAGGLMTHRECRMLVIGNPTDEATEFGIASESSLYHTMSISALDHPNIIAELNGQKPPFPNAVGLQWLYEMLTKECEQTDKLIEDSFEFVALEQIKNALEGRLADLSQTSIYMPTAYFQGRVLGEFPTQADRQVIPKAWLKGQRVLEPADTDVPELGCDVARFGDDRTTIFSRRGPCVLTGREIRKMDVDEVASACRDDAIAAARAWKPKFSREQQEALAKKFRIKVDVTGGLGVAPVVLLRGWGYTPVEVNSSERANNKELYRNKRSELWFDTRDRVREKRLDLSRLPQDIRERLKRELSAPKYEAPGKKIVEPKADTKKRIGDSPDLADGCNLAFAPEQRDRYTSSDSQSWGTRSY